MRKVIAPVISLLLSGCVSTSNFGPERADEPCIGGRIDDSAVVTSLGSRPVTDLASLKYQPLKVGGGVYSIEMDAAVAEVAGNRSRVLPLDLSGYELNHIYFLPVRSGLSGPPTLKCGPFSYVEHFGFYGTGVRAIYPRLMWLNEAKQPIGEARPEHSSIVSPAIIAWVVRFSRPAEARYAVVFAEQARLSTLFTVESATVPQFLPVPGVMVPIPVGGNRRRDTYVAVSTGHLFHVAVRKATGDHMPDQRQAEHVEFQSPDELPLQQKLPARVWWGGDKVP